jgi:hypothetical protein
MVALNDRVGRPIWEYSLQVAGGSFPLAAWRLGEIVRDVHVVTLPADLTTGTYQLTLRPVGWGGGSPYTLGKVMIKR